MKKYRIDLTSALASFALGSLFMGLYTGLYDPSFNNYLAQVHHVSEVARGGLEFPRELPGFLIALIFMLLAFMADTRMAAFSALLVGIALWGQGFLAPGIHSVVVWMLIWSVGSHLYLAISPSIALRLATAGQEGSLLGKIGFMESLGSLGGMLLVYSGAAYFHFSFGVIFGLAGTFAFLAAFLLFRIKPQPVSGDKQRLVFKKKYTLFYVLNILFGARKQIFITFAPWVLIKIYEKGIETFALLGFIGMVISLGFRPFLGKAIDKWGERLVITVESSLLIIVCILYGYAGEWFDQETAVFIVMLCYITDQLLFAVRMARTTYLSKIVDKPDDIGPSLSMGLSLDHAVSMTIPVAGGLLWTYYGFKWVFVAAAILALLNLLAVSYMPGTLNKTEDLGGSLNQ